MKSYIVTLILCSAVIFICELSHTACSQQCSKFGIDKNHLGKRMEGHIILTTSEEKIQECVKKCSILNHCLSINFERISGICDLNSIRSVDTSTDISQQETFILSDLSVWPQGMLGPCSEKPCTSRDICFPAGTTFLCRDSDCPVAPTVDGAVSTGSVEIGGTMVYRCTRPSHRLIGQDNIQCGWSNAWSNVAFTCNAVTSCADLKLCDPSAVDGTYWIYPMALHGVKIKVYCHDMDSTSKAYLTVNPTGNDMHISWPNGDTSHTTFSKIRLHLDTMTIAQDDLTFTTTVTTGSPTNVDIVYGVGAACDCWGCAHQNGYFHIDTTNTGLIIDTSITWIATGSGPIQHGFVRGSNGRTITAHGGGSCGLTVPTSPLVMHVNSDEVLHDTEATFVMCV